MLKKSRMEEKYFHTGEATINYVAGPSNGMHLVFIPGQSTTWEEYTFIMPKLAHQFRVFAVSLRGHGKSSWTPDRYTFNQLGADMTTFLNEVVGEPAIVAGNSSGGVLACWLAANASEWVRAIILEDPPLFRCEWPAIKNTHAYDLFLGMSRMAISGGGGYARFFLEELSRRAKNAQGVINAKLPPQPLMKLIGGYIALQQAFSPGNPVNLWFLPKSARIMTRGISQFDGNFSKAFVQGTIGEDFGHAATLARIIQPVLFFHANWRIHQGGLLGALDDQDVERVRSLV